MGFGRWIDCNGDVDAGGNVTINGDNFGDIDAGNKVTVSGNSEGDIDAGGNVEIGGDASGDIDANNVTVHGDASYDNDEDEDDNEDEDDDEADEDWVLQKHDFRSIIFVMQHKPIFNTSTRH